MSKASYHHIAQRASAILLIPLMLQMICFSLTLLSSKDANELSYNMREYFSSIFL